MKKYILFIIVIISIISNCRRTGYNSGDGMYYDMFRGDKSSIINIVQYEALSKCFTEFTFSIYAGKIIKYSINAANEQVYDQVKVLLNREIMNNNIKIAEYEYNENGDKVYKEYDYDLQINVVSGGYYFKEGFILNHYKSITRLVLIEKDMKTDISKLYDSKNQSYKYLVPEFSIFFIIFIYIWISIALLLIIYKLLLRKKD